MLLQPCASCHRHVDQRDRVCPFCRGALAGSSIATALPLVGRVSRAAVFAGLSACWTGNTATSLTPPDHARSGDVQVSEPPVAGLSRVEGVVTDASTRNPLVAAIVELHDQNSRRATTTDASGTYRFLDVAPGDYQIVVRYDTNMQVGSSQQPLTVHDMPQHLDIALQLLNRAQIPKPYGAPPARRRVV